MRAHGYGGTARNGDGRYKHYLWAFRDGTTLTNDDPHDDVTKYVQHAYDLPGRSTIRIQVIDADDNLVYGDSLPVRVGWRK
jgi:hypothetical protein